jgi:hypothetical protein
VKELNKREKIIVSIVTVVAVGFLVNRFVLEPQHKRMKQLRKQYRPQAGRFQPAEFGVGSEETAGSRTGTGSAPKGRDC